MIPTLSKETMSELRKNGISFEEGFTYNLKLDGMEEDIDTLYCTKKGKNLECWWGDAEIITIELEEYKTVIKFV